jgi:hypothetical protein
MITPTYNNTQMFTTVTGTIVMHNQVPSYISCTFEGYSWGTFQLNIITYQLSSFLNSGNKEEHNHT